MAHFSVKEKKQIVKSKKEQLKTIEKTLMAGKYSYREAVSSKKDHADIMKEIKTLEKSIEKDLQK